MSRLLFSLLGAGLMLGCPCPASAIGFVFSPQGPQVEVRSVLADLEVGPDRVVLRASVELAGEADRVIWIVPLTDSATAAGSPTGELDALEAASTLQVLLPASDACPVVNPGSTDSGCSCGGSTPLPTGTATVVHTPAAEPLMTARADPESTNQAPQYLRSVRAGDLMTRLEAEGVQTSSTTRAQLEQYFARAHDAVWWDLQRTPGTHRLPALSLTLAAEAPLTLPLIATAPWAAPQLDLRVLVRAAGPYLPENWVGVVPKASELVFDGQGRTSYSAWVARSSASGSGHFFSTEAVLDTPQGVTTRLYARPAPDALDRDPIFRPHPQASFRVPNQVDLSDQRSLEVCNQVVAAREPNPCAHLYCGQRSECLLVDAQAACRCPEAADATQMDSAQGWSQLTCTARTLSEPAGSAPGPCATVDCGQGTCRVRGERALCACDPGTVATLGDLGLRCVTADADAPTFGPGGGVESRARAAAFASAGGLGLLGLVIMLWSMRRRSCIG